jgi:anti-sigma factor RsiW
MNDHPISDDDLLAYASGDPVQRDNRPLAAHLATCPACAATLARFTLVQTSVRTDATIVPSAAAISRVNALIAGRRQPAPEQPSIFATLKRVVASLTFDGRSTYALAGLRGSTDAYLMRYAHDEVEVDLEIAPPGEQEIERWQITGQVSAAEPTGSFDVAFAEAGRSQPLVGLLSGDDGVFFASLSQGRYDLLIRMPENVIVVPDLEVG